MNSKDLKKGEIYIHSNGCVLKFHSLYSINTCDAQPFLGAGGRVYRNDIGGKFNISELSEATLEQKHWLLECEKANKFISYDEAMKTFIKEFVLPEFWWVQPTNQYELEQVKLFFKDKFHYDIENNSYIKIGQTFGYIPDWGKGYYYNLTPENLSNNLKLTFEQFQQYVLKQPKLNYIILQQDGDKITQVANEEGNIFMIGDRIKSIKRTLPSTIIEFKLGQTNNMLAITSQYSKNGISIDKIEHYIEPVKVVEDFKLPEKWCIKATKEIHPIIGKYYDRRGITCYRDNDKINKYFHSHNLASKISIMVENNSYGAYFTCEQIREGYTEITFEQFKEHVLGEKPQVVIADGHVQQRELLAKGIQSIVIPNESLLDKAKRLYPVGTKFRIAHFPSEIRTVKSNKEYDFTFVNNGGLHINFIVEENNDYSKNGASVYFNGKWAEIIK